MHRPHIIKAWKWLLACLTIAASISYLSTLLLAGLGIAEPSAILKTATVGIRHVASPVLSRGMVFGFDEGIMIFFVNLMVALVIISLVLLIQLLNPYNQSQNFFGLRRHLQKNCSAGHIRKIPIFAHIRSPELCLTSFLLLAAPVAAIISFGLMAGALFGSAHLLSSSPAIALAYLMPHGIPEVAAFLLAGSIPVGTWMAIKPVVYNEVPVAAFRRIDRVVASQDFQKSLKMVVTLLLIAGLIEAHLTLKVVALVGGN